MRFWLLAILASVVLALGQENVKAERVVAVGDIHGGYEEFVAVLRMADLIDAANKWTGGKTHLVQTGDVPDRGPDSRKAFELLMSLEKEAKRAGGQVHALIGNHEAMNMYGDFRYVSAAEFEAFRTPKSEKLIDDLYKSDPASRGKPTEASRATWFAAHPPGWVELRDAFSPDGRYGSWIARHNAIVKVNDTLFLHGGIGPKYANASLRQMNEQVRDELTHLEKVPGGIAIDPDGPLWYRGLADDPEAELQAHVDAVLAKHRARRMVIGHTVEKSGVKARFGGKVVMIDVGLSKAYGGPSACLVIEGEKAYALENGLRKELP